MDKAIKFIIVETDDITTIYWDGKDWTKDRKKARKYATWENAAEVREKGQMYLAHIEQY